MSLERREAWCQKTKQETGRGRVYGQKRGPNQGQVRGEPPKPTAAARTQISPDRQGTEGRWHRGRSSAEGLKSRLCLGLVLLGDQK